MKVSLLKRLFFCVLFLFINSHTLQALSVATEKKPLKILFLLPQFPKFNQTFILNQITGLIDRGHDIYIFAKRHAGPFVPPEVERYNLLEKTFYKTLPLDQFSYDIIFAQFGREGRFGMYLKKKGVTGKLITCFRGDEVTKPLPKNPHYYDELFAIGDLFLPVCDFFKENLITIGCPAEKIITLHSGIDLKKFPFASTRTITNPEKKIKILSISRLIEKKGINYAIKAIAKVHGIHKNISYTIVGDGPERKNLSTLIKKLKLQNVIHLKGWLPHEEISKILHKSHLFLQPSLVTEDGRLEGIPNTVKEAMACGIPVISTYHAGIPELVIDGISGLLVPEKTAGKLAKAINYLLTHQDRWQTMCKEARNQIEINFDSDMLNDQLEKLLYQIVEN